MAGSNKRLENGLVELVNKMREKEHEIANTWIPSCPLCGKLGSKFVKSAGYGKGKLVGTKHRYICINPDCHAYDNTKKKSISFSEDRAAYADVWGELVALKAVVIHGKTTKQAASIIEQYSPRGARNNHTYHYLLQNKV